MAHGLELFLSALYGSVPPCDYQFMADSSTDTMWDPVVDGVASLLSWHQTDVYAYRFLYGTYRHLGPPDCDPDPLAFNAWMDLSQFPSPSTGPNFGLMFGACHTLDIPFFFGNFEFYGFEPFIFHVGNSPGYELLSNAMIAYVAQFACTGDPGNADGVSWTPWANTATGPRILFDADQAENLTVMSTP